MKLKNKCPNHANTQLVKVEGPLTDIYECPVHGCSVAWYGDRGTTPADMVTRTARAKAHREFDPLWNKQNYSRSSLYKELAKFTGLRRCDTHIGKFNEHLCEQVGHFVRHVHAGLIKPKRSRFKVKPSAFSKNKKGKRAKWKK